MLAHMHPTAVSAAPAPSRPDSDTHPDTAAAGVGRLVLDAAQTAAVAYRGGPLLVEAGPGSGKTSVVAHRVASLIRDDNIHPENILAITFTNRAAAEMRSRLVPLLGAPARRVWCSTFHSACARILRTDGPAVGCPTTFKIIDEAASIGACRQAMQRVGADFAMHRPRAVLAAIAAAKNAGIDADAYMQLSKQADADPAMALTAEIYDAYQRRLISNDSVDFGDLLLLVDRLMRTDGEARSRWQRRLAHVLIDEYQDTNIVQHRIAVTLAADGALTAVGDSDQAIYGFRGASGANIADLHTTYANLKVVTLDRNYRSTGRIVAAAAALIGHNPNRPAKALHTRRGAGDPITVVAAADETDEARWVTDDIARRLNNGASPADVAVMFRTCAQSRPFENALTDAGVAFRLRSGVPFHDRREVRDAVAHVTAAAQPHNDSAVAVALNAPNRGVGPRAVSVLRNAATRAELPLADILFDHGRLPLWSDARTGIGAYLDALAAIQDTLRSRPHNPAAVLDTALDASGMRAALAADDTPASAERLETLNELLTVAGDHTTVEAFLAEIADRRRRHRRPVDGAEAVDVMTMHASKGLEYRIVYVCGFEDQLVPHLLADPAGIGEERRLAYVALTRAADTLTITRAHTRRLLPQGSSPASRFLAELPAEMIDERTTPAAEAARAGAEPG